MLHNPPTHTHTHHIPPHLFMSVYKSSVTETKGGGGVHSVLLSSYDVRVKLHYNNGDIISIHAG